MLDSIFEVQGYMASKKMLDYTALRQKVIAHNVANINTPGFKRSDVEFGEQLQELLEEGSQEQLDSYNFKIYESSDLPLRNDGNNVDIDKEMSILAENSFLFSMYAELVSQRLSGLKDNITKAGSV